MEESFGIIPLRRKKDQWQVFLVHSEGGFWGFPKGHKHDQETAKETAQRELKEETSLEVTSYLWPKPLMERYSYQKGTKRISKKVSYFLALVQGKEKCQKEEIKEGKWSFLQEALSLLTYEETRRLCNEVAKILENL